MTKDNWETRFRERIRNKEKETATDIKKEVARIEKKETTEIKSAKKEIETPVNTKWIALGSIALVLVIILVISLIAKPPVQAKYNPLDAVIMNSTGLPSNVYFQGEKIFALSGWESNLKYDGKEDRLFGKEEYRKIVFDESGKAYTVISSGDKIILEPLTSNPEKVTKIGWFTDTSKITTSEEKSWNEKSIIVSLEGDTVEEAKFDYKFYKNKPYFKIEFTADTNEPEKLEDFAYGITLNNYDIYLPDGTVFENDNTIVELDKTAEIVLKKNGNTTTNVSNALKENVAGKVDINRKATMRTGSVHEVSDARYQIFYNSEEEKAIITYSPKISKFKNSFYWNVYWIYLPHNEGYSPLYFIVLEEPELSYRNGDWQIESKQYTGSVNDYISKVVKETEEK